MYPVRHVSCTNTKYSNKKCRRKKGKCAYDEAADDVIFTKLLSIIFKLAIYRFLSSSSIPK